MVVAFDTTIIPIIYILFNVLLIVVVHLFVLPKEVTQNEKVEVLNETTQKQLSFIEFCKQYHQFMIFVLGTVAVFFTHTIINNFFIQILKPIGGNASDMGTAVFLAAIVELPAMGLFNKIREKISCSQLLKISVILFAVKHLLTLIAPNMIMIDIAQLLQVGAYAIFIPASVYYVNQIISQNDRVKGQSMVTMAITASGILANFLGGILLDAVGVNKVLMIGVVISIIGAVVVSLSIEKTMKE